MQNTNAHPRAPVSFPNHNRIITPKNSQAKPSSQTDFKLIAPAGIGRSLRYCRSKFTSNASFKNIPAMYKKVAPIRTNGSLSEWWSPPSHQPAKQFDQTVGKFETRPRIKIVRRKDMKESCYNAKRFPARSLQTRSNSPRSANRVSVQSYSATSWSTTSRFRNSGGNTSHV